MANGASSVSAIYNNNNNNNNEELSKPADLALDLSLLDKQQHHQQQHETNDDEPHAVVAAPEWSAGFLITYGAFFFAGASAVAMWSSVTLCLDFFTEKYPTERVGFVFPVVNMSTLLVISLYMVLAGRQLPLELRMNGALASYLAFVLLLPLANVVHLPVMVAYTFTILSLVGSTIASSVLQSSMYGLGGVFGPIFLQAIEGGKGFGAILLFVIRLALKRYFELSAQAHASASASTAERSDVSLYYDKVAMGVFFSIAFAIVALTWVLYTALQYTAFAAPMLVEYALVQTETPFNVAPQSLSPRSDPLVDEPQGLDLTEFSPLLRSASAEPLATGADNDELANESGSESEGDSDSDELLLLREHASSASLLTVCRVAAKPFFSLFLSFFVCLSCFPGLISAIPSTTFALGDWYPIVLVGCYNLGDLVGKNLPVYALYFDVATLHRPWFLQVAFIPFFVVALVHPLADMVTIAAVVLLGLVTGYVATSSMILAPSVCSEFQKEVAGMIGGLSAIVGLCLGSYNGLALETLIQLWAPAST